MSGLLNTFKHPKPFYQIWFVELWERFGFYGMQAILVLYLVKQLGFSDADSYNTFGAFTALLYALTSVGGYIGDKVLGTKRTIVLGAVTLCVGYIFLALGNEQTIFHGLGVIAVGNGLFKANPSSLLAKLYKPNDPKIDGAFTLYYMAINIGSFVSIAATPYVAHHYGWNIAFSLSVFGLIAGIATYLALISWVKDVGSKPDFEKINYIKLAYVLAGTIVSSFAATWILQNLILAHSLLAVAGVIIVILFVKEIIAASGRARANLIACLVLIIQAIIFFTLYQQMPTSINMFAVRNVEPILFGIEIQPATFQALNPLWIMIASPFLALLYGELGKKGKDFTMPFKFAGGMLCCSFGFLILTFACYLNTTDGIISSNWLIVSYFFQSIGELLISGLGCAMVARLCAPHLMGFMMGVWFMSTAAAMVLGGYVAAIADVPENITNHMESLHIYSNLFFYIGITTFVIAIIMFIAVPVLNKLCLKEIECIDS